MSLRGSKCRYFLHIGAESAALSLSKVIGIHFSLPFHCRSLSCISKRLLRIPLPLDCGDTASGYTWYPGVVEFLGTSRSVRGQAGLHCDAARAVRRCRNCCGSGRWKGVGTAATVSLPRTCGSTTSPARFSGAAMARRVAGMTVHWVTYSLVTSVLYPAMGWSSLENRCHAGKRWYQPTESWQLTISTAVAGSVASDLGQNAG